MINLNKITFKSHQWQFQVFSLYKRVLRLHRTKLLPAQRAIGDAYVKQEFSLNKKANERQAYEFMKEWSNYCDEIERQEFVVGKDLDPVDIEGMDDGMKEQLAKLKEEAQQYLKSVKEDVQKQNYNENAADDVVRIPKNADLADIDDLTHKHYKSQQ